MNHRTEKMIKWGPLALFFAFILIYSVFGAKHLIFGIKIENVNIQDGAIVQDSVLHITGMAEDAINLTINGREITIDQSGLFDDTIALLPGYNRVSIRALDKFGYTDEKNYQLIRQ